MLRAMKNAINLRDRRWTGMAAVVLTTAAAVFCGTCGSAPAGAASRPLLGSSTATVENLVKHPCVLFTRKQAEAASGEKLTPAEFTKGEDFCEYSGIGNSNKDINAAIIVNVQIGEVKQAASAANEILKDVPEPGLGHDAIWNIPRRKPGGQRQVQLLRRDRSQPWRSQGSDRSRQGLLRPPLVARGIRSTR